MRVVEVWFILFWFTVGIILALVLTGCELPREGSNYNPTRPYQWVPMGVNSCKWVSIGVGCKRGCHDS